MLAKGGWVLRQPSYALLHAFTPSPRVRCRTTSFFRIALLQAALARPLAAPRFLIRRAPDPCDDDRPTMAATNPFDFEDEYSDSELPPDDDGRYDDAEEEEDDDDFDAWVRKPEQIAQVLAGSVGKQAEPRRCADMTRSWSTLQPCAPHTATLCL